MGRQNRLAAAAAGVTWRYFLLPLLAWGIFVNLAAAQESQSDPVRLPPGMPVFHSESREIVLGAIVWKAGARLDGTRKSEARGMLKTIPQWAQAGVEGDINRFQPATGLTAKDLHVFDNGVEERLNYFKEADFQDSNITKDWTFKPTLRGSWGTPPLEASSGSKFAIAVRMALASYLIGYVPIYQRHCAE